MSAHETFDADWLALRAGADERARSGRLIAMAAAHLERHEGTVRLLDLGAGTGATLRALSPSFRRPQHWSLLDADEGLLARAPESSDDIAVTTVAANLDPLRMPDPAPHLVTASALFDLASAAMIDRLAERLAAHRLPLLAMLTFDGRLALDPAHALDEAMIGAFNAHQRTDKGLGGPAAGPDATDTLADALERRGYAIAQEDSAWRLETPSDAALIEAVLRGWADAAREIGHPREVDAWLTARLGRTDRLLIGHLDLYAGPSP